MAWGLPAVGSLPGLQKQVSNPIRKWLVMSTTVVALEDSRHRKPAVLGLWVATLFSEGSFI